MVIVWIHSASTVISFRLEIDIRISFSVAFKEFLLCVHTLTTKSKESFVSLQSFMMALSGIRRLLKESSVVGEKLTMMMDYLLNLQCFD